ncbi:MAG: DUF1624 domain-containing protein, partial [Candidatus Kapabacteria bacterium]|nr:DUF1624 domain-containing protein [Candidatus Kapabacteria bacterium]
MSPAAAPSLTISLSRTCTRNTPRVLTLAMTMWKELVPTSTAAIRSVGCRCISSVMAHKIRCTFGHAAIHHPGLGRRCHEHPVLDSAHRFLSSHLRKGTAAMSTQRFMFLDVARGIAVLWMIQVHITNQLIDPAIRSTIPFRALNLSNGYVAPTFIFCAGAGLWIALSRKGQDFLGGGAALWDYMRRLSFILFWAYLLHMPLYSLERWLHVAPAELMGGLQFDVLHTIVFASLTVLGVFLTVRNLVAATWITAG